MSAAFIVCDLGFGDAGKGLVTDALVRASGAPVVVRYNGGAQAGHNVVTPDGRHHTFAQLGAGSFVRGVHTFLSREVLVHPTALLQEVACFAAASGSADPHRVLDRVWISEHARIITPFHQALNRLRELARGEASHGSCGVGVGETARDALEAPDEVLQAAHLAVPSQLRRRLLRTRDRLIDEARALAERAGDHPGAALERAVFERPEVLDRWEARAAVMAVRQRIVGDEKLVSLAARDRPLVFEGAQGVLLDEWHGFHPHTTWSDCTPRNAERLLAELGLPHAPLRIGVLRSHAVRHGPGPFPSETAALEGQVREHNARNDWQGHVRYGWFDEVLARYALDRVGGVHHLALTHLDLLERRGRLARVVAYSEAARASEGSDVGASFWMPGEVGRRLRVPQVPSLEDQEALGEYLASGLVPHSSEAYDEDSFVEAIEGALGIDVSLTSRGPSAAFVELRDGLLAVVRGT